MRLSSTPQVQRGSPYRRGIANPKSLRKDTKLQMPLQLEQQGEARGGRDEFQFSSEV